MTREVLELGQASQRFTVDKGQALLDFHFLLSKGPDVVGFTEALQFYAQLRRACAERDYQLLLPPAGDTAIAVHPSHHVQAHRFEKVNDPGPHHGARGVHLVEFTTPDGERVTFAEAHWLTRRSDDGHQRLAMTKAMADVMTEAARGSRLGFWAGDTNNPDRPSATSEVDLALRKGNLTSCWDELGRYPDTHGDSTLDVVGSYDPDRRVSCLRARVWPQLHSDHRPLSAWYSIRPMQGR